MIFDTILHKDNYKHDPLLYQALCYLSQLPEGTLPLANTVLVEDVLFCNPVTLTSKPEKEGIFESHKRFIDVHYIVSGCERIYTADLSQLATVDEYVMEKDIAFSQGASDGSYLLKPGNFMVCYPNDAHKVGIMNEVPATIEKVVFKLAVEHGDYYEK
ncbi:MAG: YhcH/YjgK/YiaL family protein [Eubacteriales bacterium]